MRTRTIYKACALVQMHYRMGDPRDDSRRRRRYSRQIDVFIHELLRRMDERDALVAPRRVFLTPERIGQYMAGMSDDLKADNILGGKHEPD